MSNKVITTCVSNQHNTLYTMCVAALVNKEAFLWRCISFVDRLIVVFCFSLLTSCREMGSQSSCASSHCKFVETLFVKRMRL